MNTGIIHLIGEVGAGIIFREYTEKKTIGQHKKSIFSVPSGNKKIGRNAMKEEGRGMKLNIHDKW